MGVFLEVELGLVGAEVVAGAAVALEGAGHIGLAGVAVGALVAVAADGTTDGSLGGGLAVEGLSCGAEVSGDGGTTIVSVLEGVETAEVVAGAGSFDVDEALPDGHVHGVDVGLLAVRAHLHVGGSAADAVAAQLVVGTAKVGGATVGQRGVALIRQVGVGVDVGRVTETFKYKNRERTTHPGAQAAERQKLLHCSRVAKLLRLPLQPL